MSSNNPIQNIKNYISGSHRFLNSGTGSSSTPTNTLVTLEKRTVMTIASCNVGIGTTLPRTMLDIIGNVYVSQNIGIGTTILSVSGLNIVGNVYSSGNITATNYVCGNATFSGTLITSNLTVLGSNTIVNTYTQQSSNFSICNVVGTGPALSVIQKGIGAGYPIADFYDLDVSTTVPALRIADGGNVGIGTDIPVANLHIEGNIYSSANIGIGTTLPRQVLDMIGDMITTGNIGIGITLPSARLQVAAGTKSIAPLQFTPGTNLSSIIAGSIEYDGINFYGTPDTRSGRGYFPDYQIYRLAIDSVAIGPTIARYFAGAINLIAGGIYELEGFMYFTKTTIGTVTITLTTTQNVVNITGTIDTGAAAGGTATGAGTRLALYKSATTDNTFPISPSLSATNHAYHLRAIVEANASLNSTLAINITSSAGTVTPLQGSFYIINRIPDTNTGIFS